MAKKITNKQTKHTCYIPICDNIVYMHDGAPVHFAQNISVWRNTSRTDGWFHLMVGGIPGLNLLDVFVWGFINKKKCILRLQQTLIKSKQN